MFPMTSPSGGLKNAMASNGYQDTKKTTPDNSLLLAQIQAFLDAAEDVEIDTETRADLIETFSEHQELEKDTVVDNGSDVESEDDNAADNHDSEELDISALYRNRKAGES